MLALKYMIGFAIGHVVGSLLGVILAIFAIEILQRGTRRQKIALISSICAVIMSPFVYAIVRLIQFVFTTR